MHNILFIHRLKIPTATLFIIIQFPPQTVASTPHLHAQESFHVPLPERSCGHSLQVHRHCRRAKTVSDLPNHHGQKWGK
ncbi:hypothetical protein TNCT_662031 [Trichonephila clavata]|uniref:Secreted protein n=1 Tax=Trichonephila clavata TaxID=2740835 RepID=A0A8X6M5B5_TRICU|nr:hypothetical protein TNCT_662031 [Trichonephila clavata]